MAIDHLGLVVKSIEKAIEHWTTIFGYEQMTEIIDNVKQKVKVVFMKKEGSTLIKLVEPIDKTSPVFSFAVKGGGLHHIAFRCENLTAEMTRLKENGLRVITVPQPGEAFNNNLIAFMIAKDGLNIELIDTIEKTNIINDRE